MQVTKLELEHFRRFPTGQVLPFAYPEEERFGKKQGTPFRKVCFIGQSGTGKTQLLHLISQLAEPSAIKGKATDYFNDKTVTGILTAELPEGDTLIRWQRQANDNSPPSLYQFITGNPDAATTRVVCIPAESASQVDQYLAEEPAAGLEDFFELAHIKGAAHQRNRLLSQPVLNLGQMDPKTFWPALLATPMAYKQLLAQKLLQIDRASGEPKARLQQEFEAWKAANPNPLNEMARKLAPLLAQFGLAIDPDALGEQAHIKLFKIAQDTQTQEPVPHSGWSTGTKQLLSLVIPLLILVGNRPGIVLIDEPERSLFPDLQLNFIEYLATEIVPNAQLFVATHSPIIAAQFAPEERFILHFAPNEEALVEVHQGLAPVGDDPNDLLSQDFGLEALMPAQGQEQWEKYVAYMAQAQQLQNQNAPKEQVYQMLGEAEKIAERYNFLYHDPYKKREQQGI